MLIPTRKWILETDVACLIVNDTAVREKLYDTVKATTR